MNERNRWTVPTLLAGCLLTVAGLAFAAATVETGASTASDADGAPTEVRRSQLRLVLDADGDEGGGSEQIELTDLHEMEVGESRTLTTASGTPVVVTRDEQGFELDLEGKKIRVMDHFSGEPGELSWTSSDGGTALQKKIVVQHEGDSEGGANVMILRNKVAAEGDGEAGEDVVVMRRLGGEAGHAFAFKSGDGELPALALPLEATIARLEASAKFQELDAETRAKVLEALRESAPKPGAFVVNGDGGKTIVLEMKSPNGSESSH